MKQETVSCWDIVQLRMHTVIELPDYVSVTRNQADEIIIRY